MRRKYITILFVFSLVFAKAQELICDVSVAVPNASKVTTDPKVFKALEGSIQELMNNTKWTNDIFEEKEKIECSILLNISGQSGNTYSGSLTVVSKRPVYNSNYKTTVLNVIDQDITFQYIENAPIEFSENQFTNNLSHILAFYAYLSIGLDYETFSQKGGEQHLLKAQELCNLVSNSDAGKYKGWKSFDKNKRNRYWQITHLLNNRYEKFRSAQYKYYRLGLDQFHDKPEEARQNIKEALEQLAKVSQDDPNITVIQMWNDTKRNETIEIFKGASTEEKATIIRTLKEIDPVNSDKFDVILK